MQNQSVRPQTLETSSDYRPALLWLMGKLGQARTSEVIAEFERRLGDLIPPEHREPTASGEMKWSNNVRWARQYLVTAGLMGSSGYGIWTISQAGREWLQQHPDGGKRELAALIQSRQAAKKAKSRPAREPVQHAIRLAGETFKLSKAGVLDAVRVALADGVPPEAKRFTSWFLPVDGERLSVKWVMSLVTGLPTRQFTSDQARRQLKKLGLEAQPVEDASAVTSYDTVRESAELTREAFYRTVLARLKGRLPAEVYNRRVNPRANYLQLTCPAPGTHYELRLLRSYTEIAIHFEGRRERNLALLDQFRPHVEGLRDQLDEPVHAESWGRSWARVYLKRPPARLDVPTAETLADDWLRFIEATLPVVEKAVANLGLRVGPGRPSVDVKGKSLDRAEAILAQEIRNIRAYLNGDRSLSPSDEKLCDWVQFCYTFELFTEGATLFRLIRPDAVYPWLYERTRKLARACELRIATDRNLI